MDIQGIEIDSLVLSSVKFPVLSDDRDLLEDVMHLIWELLVQLLDLIKDIIGVSLELHPDSHLMLIVAHRHPCLLHQLLQLASPVVFPFFDKLLIIR